MKKSVFLRLFLIFLTLGLISCGGSSSSNEDASPNNNGGSGDSEGGSTYGSRINATGEEKASEEKATSLNLERDSNKPNPSELIFNTVFEKVTEIYFSLNKEPSLLSCSYGGKILEMQTLTQYNYNKEQKKSCEELKSDKFLQALGFNDKSVSGKNRLILIKDNASPSTQKNHIIVLTKGEAFTESLESEVLNELSENYIFSIATPDSFFINGDNIVSAKVKIFQKNNESSLWTVSEETETVAFMKASNILNGNNESFTCSSDNSKQLLSPSSAFMTIKRVTDEYYFVLNFISGEGDSPSRMNDCTKEGFNFQENSIYNTDILKYFEKNKDAVRAITDKTVPFTFLKLN